MPRRFLTGITSVASRSTTLELPILEPGVSGQIRAGRVLTLADFTNLGLRAPIGLYNLSDLNDSSGNNAHLTTKNGDRITAASGITGAAGEARQFRGTDTAATTPSLYPTGSSAQFSIRTGSMGCWFRTPHRTAVQSLITKRRDSSGSASRLSYILRVASSRVQAYISINGTSWINLGSGAIDVADDRWHFAVMTHDGTQARLYTDGVSELALPVHGLIADTGSDHAFNIGGAYADATNNGLATESFNGRIDEAFITHDVLTEEQVRLLYAAALPHSLGSVPRITSMAVRRQRRGRRLTQADFSQSPLRLYNMVNGLGSDAGTQGVSLGTGPGVNQAAAPDGIGRDGAHLNGTSDYMAGSDAGLPAGTTARTLGCWMKYYTHPLADQYPMIFGYGDGDHGFLIPPNNHAQAGHVYYQHGTQAAQPSAPGLNDGEWHFIVGVLDNDEAFGLRLKLYVDGKVRAHNVNLATHALSGAAGISVGRRVSTAHHFGGQVARAFVCGYAMDADEVNRLYNLGAQDLGVSYKNPGTHIERAEATRLLVIHDTLEPTDTVAIEVAP